MSGGGLLLTPDHSRGHGIGLSPVRTARRTGRARRPCSGEGAADVWNATGVGFRAFRSYWISRCAAYRGDPGSKGASIVALYQIERLVVPDPHVRAKSLICDHYRPLTPAWRAPEPPR